MEKDDFLTDVIFRKWRTDGSIIALFPRDIETHTGFISSYEHVGQHSAADYAHCIHMSVPAQPFEYKPLLAELESIGYNLRVMRKKHRIMQTSRK